MIVKGMNASQVATLAGCNPSTVRNIISGRIKTPSEEMSKRISAVLEDDFEIVDPDVLEDDWMVSRPKNKRVPNLLLKRIYRISLSRICI